MPCMLSLVGTLAIWVLVATILQVRPALAQIDDGLVHSALNHPKYKSTSLGRALNGRYIIEFSDEYTGSSLEFVDSLQTEMQEVDPAFKQPHFRMSIANDFHSPSIFRGVSIHMHHTHYTDKNVNTTTTSEQRVLQRILEKHHVKQVFPVTEIPRPSLYDIQRTPFPVLHNEPNTHLKLPFSHALTQVDRVHRELGLYGKDVIVGIIDTGIDYNHPALGGGFGPGHRVRYGYDLVGDDFDMNDPSSIKESETPMDSCGEKSNLGGHGTHVAGIIGANDTRYNFTGVAPDATLGMWRVFGCSGSTSNDLVIKALIMAHEAGCQVINLSLGGPSGWENEPSSVVADRLASKGVSVVVAAGNEGAQGAFLVAAPSTGRRSISVASVDNSYNLQRTIVTSSNERFAFTMSTSTSTFPNGKLVLYDDSGDNLACNATNHKLRGKIVLVQRGICPFDDKAVNAANAGAIAVISYDNVGNDAFQPQTKLAPIPFIAVSNTAGKRLSQLIEKSGQVPITLDNSLSPVAVSTAGRISKFSSIGPTNNIDLKPNLAGVGGFIFSTLPLALGGYGILSGTSMASPYVAGSMALALERHRNSTNAVAVSDVFQNYGKIVYTTDGVENPARQGAGLLQVYDTIQSAVRVSPGQLSFNDTVRRQPGTLTIFNTGNVPITFKVQHVASRALAPYQTNQTNVFTSVVQPIVYTTANVTASLSFSATQIIVQPNTQAELHVAVDRVSSSTKDQPYPLFGGFIQLVPDTNLPTIHVPYVGTEGNVTELPIFAKGFPTLTDALVDTDAKAASVANSISSEILSEKNYHHTVREFYIDRMASNSPSVNIIYRLQTGSAHMLTEILDSNFKRVGTLPPQDYLVRHTLSDANSVSTDKWNGTVIYDGFEDMTSAVPVNSGTYYLQWKALRLMADPQYPESWETVLSDPIVVT